MSESGEASAVDTRGQAHRGRKKAVGRAAAPQRSLTPADPDATARSDAAVGACFVSEDFAEGRRALADKRQPVFRGR